LPDETPRAVLRAIADATGEGGDPAAKNIGVGVGVDMNHAPTGTTSSSQSTPSPNPGGRNSTHHRIRIVASEAGPPRQEDVLCALQILTYLTKYPHVRQEFHKQRVAPSPPPWLQLAPNALPSPQTPTMLFSFVARFTFHPSLSQFSNHPGLLSHQKSRVGRSSFRACASSILMSWILSRVSLSWQRRYVVRGEQ